MVTSTYAKAYTEVYEILNHLDEDELSKIPKEKIDFFKENRDKEYKFKIDTTIDLNQQEFSRKTYAIIISLFKEYIATEIQKDEINRLLRYNQEIIEEEKREQYNPDDIFKNRRKENTNVEERTELSLEVREEKLFQKLINYIKSWFIKIKKNN